MPPAMIRIEGGEAVLGSEFHYPEERPLRRCRVTSFAIAPTPVTNRDFAAFVAATDYTTTAERGTGARPPGSLVFRMPDEDQDIRGIEDCWHWVEGASWRHPQGPQSSIAGMDDHPVVHVSRIDAERYVRWAGMRLPSEAEWEHAAQGGNPGTFPWGEELFPNGVEHANIWRGDFPIRKHPALDKWPWTTPVAAYPPNGFGLHDMIGNVWEWTSDTWTMPDEGLRACCTGSGQGIETYVMKGGSHLCSPDFCQRYRPASRQPVDGTASYSHLGFRCAAS